jgi:hypothetical protein
MGCASRYQQPNLPSGAVTGQSSDSFARFPKHIDLGDAVARADTGRGLATDDGGRELMKHFVVDAEGVRLLRGRGPQLRFGPGTLSGLGFASCSATLKTGRPSAGSRIKH